MRVLSIGLTRAFFCCALLMVANSIARAQNQADYPKIEVFAGFSALGESEKRTISFGTFGGGAGYATPAGFETSVIRNFTKHVGLKGDFSAHFKNDTGRTAVIGCTPVCTTVTQDFQIKTRVYNFLVGPEFRARNRTRFTPFAHVLAGVAHTSANFTTTGPTFNVIGKRSDNGFAMAMGGGLDIRASKRVSFRAQMDYNPIFIGSDNKGSRDLARVSLGVLFH
ncbi:MAG TPA: outer membrane beta-barrel protein [Pyrinomonadaceae bacterium]|nr:outer membrane beta-barrel protein [Pyrinomonadaceae bacterium]